MVRGNDLGGGKSLDVGYVRDPTMGGGEGILGAIVVGVGENARDRTGKDACTLVA